jgi:DNA-binding CsgD family transcriptional regulator
VLRRALESAEDHDLPQRRVRLTERENPSAFAYLGGLANKQIGDRLQISESAVKACLPKPFAKTGVRTRSHWCALRWSGIATRSSLAQPSRIDRSRPSVYRRYSVKIRHKIDTVLPEKLKSVAQSPEFET